VEGQGHCETKCGDKDILGILKIMALKVSVFLFKAYWLTFRYRGSSTFKDKWILLAT